MMETKKELQQFIEEKIKFLSEEELRAIDCFIDSLYEESHSLREPAASYFAGRETLSEEDEAFNKGLEEAFKDAFSRNPSDSFNEKYPLDEIFDELTNMMSAHYGVDMRKLSDRYNL